MSGKVKILLVENDPFQYCGLKAFLVGKGLSVSKGEIIDSYEAAVLSLETELPDIAILDVELNGKKDGIDLAEYLGPLNIPIIFLTSHDSSHNLDRARKLLPHGFIAKTEKPYDERNLWNAISMAIQYVNERKKLLSKGISLRVKEVELPIIPRQKTGDDDLEHLKIEKIFDWDNILYFYSGPDAPHNYIIIRVDYSGKKGFLYKASLNYFETSVPSFFVRINVNFIINARQITQHNLPNKIFMKNQEFVITKSYSRIAENKIKMILGI
jgi:DNA-binding NarL/FixJ family response regulator